MAGIVPKAAELDTLTDMIASLLSTWRMRLFASNITPDANTTLATLMAAEATFTGYAASVLSTWSAPSIDGTGAAISTTAQGTFTGTGVGGTGNLYGYFLTDAGGTKLFGVERFGTAPQSFGQNVSLAITETYSAITRF